MSLVFSVEESYVLETAIKAWVPVQFLFREDADTIFNTKKPEVKDAKLVEAICHLADSGMIWLKWRGERPSKVGRQDVEKVRTRRKLSKQPSLLLYGLSPKGGERWEVIARPSWYRFVEGAFNNLRKRADLLVGELRGVKRTVVKQYMSGLQYIGFKIVGESQRWHHLEPFRVTYWKSLPKGWRVRFRCSYSLEGDWRFENVPAWFWGMQNWYKRSVDLFPDCFSTG